MKTKLTMLVAMTILAVSLVAAPPGVMRTNVTLAWTYPTDVYAITNGTTIQWFTNEQDLFKVYSSTNFTLNTTNWPVITTVPGTNRTVTLPMIAEMRFFVMTTSNWWGESGFSNVAWTPPPPSDELPLGLK